MRSRIFFSSFLLLLCLLIPIPQSQGNPLISDSGGGGSPLSLHSDSSLYLSKEDLTFTFNTSFVSVLAYYYFKNLNSTPLSINISLPFLQPPKQLLITENSSLIPIVWTNSSLTHVLERISHSEAIQFSMDFLGLQEKMICVTYNRNYTIHRNIVIYRDNASDYLRDSFDFRYLVGTAKAWNHPIDQANFTFIIPKTISGNCSFVDRQKYGYTVLETELHTQLFIKYTNWTPNSEFIGFGWDLFVEYSTYPVLFLELPVVIFSLCVVIFNDFRKKRKHVEFTTYYKS